MIKSVLIKYLDKIGSQIKLGSLTIKLPSGEILKFSGKKGPKLKFLMGDHGRSMGGHVRSVGVSGRLKGGHCRSPGGYKMLIANAIAELRLFPSFFGSDI